MRKRSLEIVDEAVEKNPLNPMMVEVELYPVLVVNGKAKFDFELRVVCKSEPFNESEPKYPFVDEAYVDEKRVDEALVNVCLPVQLLALPKLIPTESAETERVESTAKSIVLLVERSPPPVRPFPAVMVTAFDAGVKPKSDDDAALLTLPFVPTYAKP